MLDVSASGVSLTIIGSVTFPQGFEITEFAEDADPVDNADVQIADGAVNLNGIAVFFAKASLIEIKAAVIPGSDADVNLSILHEANRPGRGKSVAGDVISGVLVWPDGRQQTFDNGRMISGPSVSSTASSGRKKTKVYSFKFENRSGDPG